MATRGVVIAAWIALLLGGVVPAAHAVGLPFVDIPTAGDVASDAMDAASKAIVNLIASAVASLTNEIIKVSDTVGAPRVGADNAWFTASYKRTMGVSLYLMAIVSLVAITAAGIRGKVGDIVQVVLVGVPGSVVAMMLATLGVQLALALSDAMTAYTFRSSVGDIQSFLHDIGVVFTSTDGAAQGTAVIAPGLVLIIGLLLIVAQLVILAVLVIRAALIYIVLLFLPLVFAMQVWPATRHMTRKALELLAVLILSKFAIFTCFALGAGATSDALTGSGSGAVQSAIIGLGVMVAAAFSPMLLMSIIPGIAGSFGAGMPGGTAGAGALGVQSPSQIMRSTLASVHTVRGGGHSSNTARRSSSSSSSTRSQSPKPPAASTPGSNAAVEQAHGSRPALTSEAAGSSASVLASGAQSAATTTARATTPTGASSPEPVSTPAASSAGDGPHVVASSDAPSTNANAASGSSSGSGSSQATTTAPSPTASPSSAPGGPVPQAALAASGEGASSPDGFSRVSTRQPFTLETT